MLSENDYRIGRLTYEGYCVAKNVTAAWHDLPASEQAAWAWGGRAARELGA